MSYFRRLSLRYRLLSAFVFCAAISSLTVIVGIFSLNRILENLVDSTHYVNTSIDRLNSQNHRINVLKNLVMSIGNSDLKKVESKKREIEGLKSEWSETEKEDLNLLEEINTHYLSSRISYLLALRDSDLESQKIKDMRTSIKRKNEIITDLRKKSLGELTKLKKIVIEICDNTEFDSVISIEDAAGSIKTKMEKTGVDLGNNFDKISQKVENLLASFKNSFELRNQNHQLNALLKDCSTIRDKDYLNYCRRQVKGKIGTIKQLLTKLGENEAAKIINKHILALEKLADDLLKKKSDLLSTTKNSQSDMNNSMLASQKKIKKNMGSINKEVSGIVDSTEFDSIIAIEETIGANKEYFDKNQGLISKDLSKMSETINQSLSSIKNSMSALVASYHLNSLIKDAILSRDKAEIALKQNSFNTLLNSTLAVFNKLPDNDKCLQSKRHLDLLSVLGNKMMQVQTEALEDEHTLLSSEKMLALTSEKMLKSDTKMALSVKSIMANMEKLEKKVESAGEEMTTRTESVMNEGKSLVKQRRNIQILIGIGVFIAAVFIALLFSLLISRGVGQATQLAVDIRSGDFSKRIESTSEDEIGKLTTCLNAMAEKLQENDVKIKKNLGDLKNIFERIDNSSEILSDRASFLSESSENLSRCATEQASELNEISNSTLRIGDQTKQDSGHASEASELAVNCEVLAKNGNTKVNDMLTTMEDISQEFGKIKNIMKIIDDISFQTNILALNAAVEAARAGKYGKGFAVVADEVRNLADRSSKAAKETDDLINNSTVKVKNGMLIANEAVTNLNEILESAVNVSKHLHDISNSCSKQANSIEQVSQSLGQIDRVTKQNMTNAGQTAAASKELSEQSENLRKIMTEFQKDSAIRKIPESNDTSSSRQEISGASIDRQLLNG